jgi:hypothetical protein
MPGLCSWFSESLTGIIIHYRTLCKLRARLDQARGSLRSARQQGEPIDAHVTACFNAFVQVHFARLTLMKFVAETISATHDLGYHSNTKVAMLASLSSALISTYSQSAKLWK